MTSFLKHLRRIEHVATPSDALWESPPLEATVQQLPWDDANSRWAKSDKNEPGGVQAEPGSEDVDA